MEKWAEFYGKNKFPDEFISKVAPQFVFSDLKDDTDGKFSVTIPHEWVCDFLKGDKSKKGKIIEEYKKIKEETYATIRERLKNALRQRTICGCDVFKNRPFVVETSFFVDYNLPKECTCVHYSGFDGFHFFLVKDLKRKINHAMYNLVVYAPFKHDTFCLLSDIPTVSRCYRAVYTDHEISKIDRQRMGNLIRFDCLRANFGKRPYVWEIFSHWKYDNIRCKRCNSSSRMGMIHEKWSSANANTEDRELTEKSFRDLYVERVFGQGMKPNGEYVEYKRGAPTLIKPRPCFALNYNFGRLKGRTFRTPYECLCAVKEARKWKPEELRPLMIEEAKKAPKKCYEAELKNEIIEEEEIEDKKES